MNRIETFKQLMDEISWSWESTYELRRNVDVDGKVGFSLNKLYITPDRVSYKCDAWELAPGVFDKVELFYQLLNS